MPKPSAGQLSQPAPVPRAAANGNSTRRRPGELRSDIVRAARQLFLEGGFDGTSMRDIAAATGTSQAMLYRHFPSKVALFRETVVSPFHEFVAELLEELKSHSATEISNHDLFAGFTAQVFDLSVQNRRLLLAMFAAHEFSAEAVGDVVTPAGPGLLDLISELKSEHEARDWMAVDVEVATRASVAMILGLALFEDWLFPRGSRRPSRKRMIDELTKMQQAAFSRTE
jgi:AcrR family transcriptional regulator